MRKRVMPYNRIKGGRQIRHRESDDFVVPVKAGNSAGGKEVTYGTAMAMKKRFLDTVPIKKRKQNRSHSGTPRGL